MSTFRFGVVSGAHGDARTWSERARRLEGSGYSALLVPDTLFTPSPFLVLAVAWGLRRGAASTHVPTCSDVVAAAATARARKGDGVNSVSGTRRAE